MKFALTASGARRRSSTAMALTPESASQIRCGSMTMPATITAIHGSIERKVARAWLLKAVNSTSSPTRISPT